MAFAFAVRLGVGIWWQAHLPSGVRFGFGDSESYWCLGEAIADGEPYEYRGAEARIFRAPGYPFLLAALFRLCGPSVLAARAASAACGALAVGGLYWLGQRLFDRTAARFAAACAALYPGQVLLGALVLSEAPFSAVMLLEFACWVEAWRSKSRCRAIGFYLATGVAAGLATLIRPSWFLFTPFALAAGVVVARRHRRHLMAAPIALAAFAVVMLPWWIRNARLTGRFVPTTLTVGASLYDGLNQQATGASNMGPVTARWAELRRELASQTATTPVSLELKVDQALRHEAIDWARQHPWSAGRLALIKLVRMWNLWPNDAQFRRWPLRLAVALTYGPLLVLGLVGSWRFRHLGWPIVLCLLPAIYFSLLHMVFVSSLRYRQPALLLLALPAAALLAQVVQPRRAGNSRPRTEKNLKDQRDQKNKNPEP
ncbi:MAG: ArnT family glycosyltransferase [Pirellulales bacterium]